MIEVEAKFSVYDHDPFVRKLKELGAKKIRDGEIEDTYFDVEPLVCNESRTLDSEGKALRVRKTDEYVSIDFKGPKIEGKARKEITCQSQMSTSDVTALEEILIELGYHELAHVSKYREEVDLGQFTVCLDSVEDLGLFVEVEMMIESGSVHFARQQVLCLASELGLRPEDEITKSYLEMALEAKQ